MSTMSLSRKILLLCKIPIKLYGLNVLSLQKIKLLASDLLEIRMGERIRPEELV